MDIVKKTRPKIEDVIHLQLKSETKENALGFVTCLRENKMAPSWGYGSRNANSNGKRICNIGVDEKGWRIMLCLDNIRTYEQTVLSEGLQEIIWKMMIYCQKQTLGCGAGCRGQQLTIFGKDFNNLCYDKYVTLSRFWISIGNPDKEMVAAAIRLLELEQKTRKGMLD